MKMYLLILPMVFFLYCYPSLNIIMLQHRERITCVCELCILSVNCKRRLPVGLAFFLNNLRKKLLQTCVICDLFFSLNLPPATEVWILIFRKLVYGRV